MIQRIQTVWLLLASVLILLTIHFSTYVGGNNEGALYIINGKENAVLTFTTTAVAVAALIALFLFKHRKTQIRVVFVSIFLECIVLFLYYKAISNLQVKGAFSITAALHPLVIIVLFLAIRGIANDEKLLKESNRLR
jgi:drug/metabolite transporter (DMT)-like permease